MQFRSTIAYQSFEVCLLSVACCLLPVASCLSSAEGTNSTSDLIITQIVSPDPQLNQLLIQGMEKGIQGDYQGAIADFSEVIRRDPNELEAYYNRGIAYAHLTYYQSAIADFEQVISLNPDLAEAYLERAKVYYQLRNYSQTKTDLQTAIQLFQQQQNASGYQEAQDLFNQL